LTRVIQRCKTEFYRRFLLKLLFFSLLLLNIHLLFSQELAFPPKVNLFQHTMSQRHFHELPYARIWGWSAEGKVAYSVAGSTLAGQIIDFVILDLVTNNNVFELRMAQYRHHYTIYDETLYSFYAADILGALMLNNIINKRTDFLPFPFKANSIEYNVQLIVEYQKDQMDLGRDNVDVVSGYMVVVTANDRRKIIANFDALSNVFVSVFSVYVAGYFLSPFESRLLVVVAERLWVHSMWELRYRFIGFNLDIGLN